MRPHDPIQENDVDDDAVWNVLEKAGPAKASGRFADDVVRSVRLLPEQDPVWSQVLRFSPVAGIAACVLLVFSLWMNVSQESDTNPSNGGIASSGGLAAQKAERWERIEDAAEVEMLVAAVDHLDEFSDQELITMIGL